MKFSGGSSKLGLPSLGKSQITAFRQVWPLLINQVTPITYKHAIGPVPIRGGVTKALFVNFSARENFGFAC